jgi:WD40 repeat protein
LRIVAEHPWRYDLFISYAAADKAWVEGYLLDAFDGAGVLYLHETSFAIGAPRLSEFERAAQECRRTLLVLSPAHLADGFSAFLDILAQTHGAESGTWPVIPLLLMPCELPPRLRMLTVLDATDSARWEAVVARLCEALDRPVPGPGRAPQCPYPGMRPFAVDEAVRFYGRDDEITNLAEKVAALRRVFVLGPSGSGKSSLVHAGLVPRLHRSEPERWLTVCLRPGAEPLLRLAEALGGFQNAMAMEGISGATIALDSDRPGSDRPGGVEHDRIGSQGTDSPMLAPDWAAAAARFLALAAPAERFLLVVDQAEELFTLGATAPEQADFVAALDAIRSLPACRLVVTLRSDFLGDLQNSDFWPVDPSEQVQIGPLRGDDLRDAIRNPAEAVGVAVDPALVERLAADAAGAPGALPMLQEALRRLWRNLERRYLALDSYEILGRDGQNGLVSAISAHADGVLRDEINSDAARAVARRIFLRLIQFGEGRADTRRQQPKDALRAAGEKSETLDNILSVLVDNRLLTSSGDAGEARVDIAHEALITGWPMLRRWIDERRQAEQTRRRLEEKAAEWRRYAAEEQAGGLLDMVELPEAEAWLVGDQAADLGRSEAIEALVAASRSAIADREARERRSVEEQARREAQLEGVRRGRRLAWLFVGVASVALFVAIFQWRNARRLGNLVKANELASQAQVLVSSRPQRALLLGIEAMRVAEEAGDPRPGQVETALREVRRQVQGRPLTGHADSVETLAVSPDGEWLATGSDDGTARLWPTGDPNGTPIILSGHTGEIVAMAFEPGGAWLATGSEDATVRLWSVGNVADRPRILEGHEGPIVTLAISPDGHWLATGGDDATARLWRVDRVDADPVLLQGHTDKIESLAFSPDGDWLASAGDDGTARLWRLDELHKDPIVLAGHEDQIEALAFSPDGQWLATGGYDRTTRIWSVNDAGVPPIVLGGFSDAVAALAFSPDSRWLSAASHDASIRLWSVLAPEARPFILREHDGPVVALAFSPDGQWLATTSDDGTARIWPVAAVLAETGAEPLVLRGHDDQAEALVFSGDGAWLATSSRDGTARLWPVGAISAEPIAFGGAADPLETVVFSPDGKWLVVAGEDGKARMWRAEDLDVPPVVLRGHEAAIGSAAFTPDGRWLATGSQDKTVRLWRVDSPLATPIMLSEHDDSVEAVAFSPDGKWLATGSDDTMALLWWVDDLDADPIRLSGHEDEVDAVAFSPNGEWLATGSDDETVRLWAMGNDVAEPITLRGQEGSVESVAFSPDGEWLAAGGDEDAVRMWRMDDLGANPVFELRQDDDIQTVAFSPDGRWLASGGTDTTARLWRVGDSEVDPIVLRGHSDAVAGAAFSPDGRSLATVGLDSTTRLWQMDPAAISAGACDTAGRNLSAIEWSQFLGNLPYECTCPAYPPGAGAPFPAPNCTVPPPTPRPTATAELAATESP